jgi:hypothetical protein
MRTQRTESEFFERLARRLGPQPVDAGSFNENPAAVEEEPVPADVAEAKRVDVGSEELRTLAEESIRVRKRRLATQSGNCNGLAGRVGLLEDGETTRSCGIWKEFDEVG